MTEENKKSLMALDDEILDAVTGGVSLYEVADGLDRDSWFVNLVRRRLSIGGRPYDPHRTDPRNRELAALFVGEYSSRP